MQVLAHYVSENADIDLKHSTRGRGNLLDLNSIEIGGDLVGSYNQESNSQHIQYLLENFVDEVNERIGNLENLLELMPQIEQDLPRYKLIEELLYNQVRKFSTEFSNVYREIMAGKQKKTEVQIKQEEGQYTEEALYAQLETSHQNNFAV